MRKRGLLVCLLVPALVGGGCGASDDPGGAARQASASGDDAGPPAAPAADWATLKKAAGPLADRLLVPQGPPPEKLVIRDLRAGAGPVIQEGDWFTINYGAYLYGTGEPREEFWSKPGFQEPFEKGILVNALEVGLKGMRVGGVRELIAPARLAYGDEAVVYLVKLRNVRRI
ncbi:MAG TPA: FKBP-type peptidyl-prolyl cis-trans isomerase [Solirubrobacterales bacterium]|nr:FKBP-type peptidyl-prolyl cis-trans isomerase [Solirubrobacterales bacterium]